MGNFDQFLCEFAVGGKTSTPLKRFCARLNANPKIQTTFFSADSIKTLLLKQTHKSTGAQQKEKKNLSTT